MRLPSGNKTALGGLAVVIAGLCIFMLNISISAKKENAGLKTGYAELLALKDEHEAVKSLIIAAEEKKSGSKVEGAVQAIDEIFRSIGMERKVKSVKSLGVHEKKFGTEEEAELQIEKVDMNQMINILYRIENAPMVLSVRKTSVKTAFDNPSLLNITMTVGLVKLK